MNEWIFTTLPEGTYCDIISGDIEGGQCTGSSYYVFPDGMVNIEINAASEDPIVAFHLGRLEYSNHFN